MKKEKVLRYIRLTAILQVGLSVVVVLISLVFGLLNPFALGTVFTFAGAIILALAFFLTVGGFFSKAEDLTAFSLTGVGNMHNHIRNVRHAGQDRLVFIILGIVNGVLPILIGFLLQTLGS